MLCQSCDVVRINGKICHEHNCPDSWKDEVRICKWCGSQFKPESKGQICCDANCYADFVGIETTVEPLGNVAS